jgi:integrase/recombinase XerC
MDYKENPGASASDIAAARLLVQRMGIDPADLLHDPVGSSEIPTFADYIPRVSQAVGHGTRRVYSTYWNRVLEAWGPRLITSLSPLEISQLAQDIKTNVTPRRNARGGQGAAEHLIGALRCMYNHAVADRILSEAENPAARVPKPRRSPSARMALPDSRLSEITAVAASTGNDPALDSLIIRLHMETALPTRRRPLPHPGRSRSRAMPHQAAREGHGALAASFPDANGPPALPRGKQRRPKVPRTSAPLRATCKPITSRRYDYLWERLGEHLPWVKTQQVSTHWIRHTILTWVERRFGFAIAQAYAGHQNAAQGARAMSSTGTYVRAGLPEVATALAVLTGEPHPLAPGDGSDVNH